MSSWLRWVLGLDEGEIPPGGITRLELGGIPGGFWGLIALAVAVAAIVLVVLIYRRESELAWGKRFVLTGLRLLALAAVILVLLNPRLLVEMQARRLAQTLLLVDGSGSMSFSDSYPQDERHAIQKLTGLDPERGSNRPHPPTRADVVTAALEKSELAQKLGKTNQVRSYVFDEKLAAVEPDGLAAAVRAAPKGERSTWLGTALRSALEAAQAEPIAAVVLITDGRSNGGDSLEGAAAELEARAVPVHAIGIGRAQAPKNLTVVELNAPEVAEIGMPLRLQARVRGSGYPGEVEVKLSRIRLDDKSIETVGTQSAPLREFEGEALVNWSDVPPRAGRYRYVAEIAPHPGEESLRDNRRTAEVVLASEKCRLLLIAGGPSYEFRYLRNFFIRDSGIQASTWLEGADPGFPQDGDIPLRALPATEAELRPYDVVVLVDPDPDELPRGFLTLLERFVAESGGGLAFVAGEHFTKSLGQSAEGARLAALLPVVLEAVDPGHDHRRPFRPKPTVASASHALCQLKDTVEESRKLWAILPKLYFRFPVTALKPGATELWEANGKIAAAVQQAGAGRALFLATDDLWRWREYQEAIHEQFWSGAARFLALGKRIAGTRQVAISTDRERYLAGEEVRIEAHILDAGHQPYSAPRVGAEAERAAPDEELSGGASSSGDGPPPTGKILVSLEAVSGRPGWFRGRLKADETGSYRLTLKDIPAEGMPAGFSVVRHSGETEDPSPDFAVLADLAKRTGGSFAPLPGITSIAERVPDRTVIEVLGRKTATVWDSAALLMVFAGALIVEWSLRKKWRLC